MRTKLEKKFIDLIREGYEDKIYTTLLEMDVIKNDGTSMMAKKIILHLVSFLLTELWVQSHLQVIK